MSIGAIGTTVLDNSVVGPYIEDLTSTMPITHNRAYSSNSFQLCRLALRDFQKSISLSLDRGKSIYNCPAPSDSHKSRCG